MKNFQDLLKDLHENEDLRFEAKKAMNSDTLKVTEEQYSAVVAFGKEHGYEFTEEDIHMHHAGNRALDDDELELVSGGGHSDYCNCGPTSACDRSWGCYNDYLCARTQRTATGGKGHCAFDYACGQTWNSCFISNKCEQETLCKGDAY